METFVNFQIFGLLSEVISSIHEIEIFSQQNFNRSNRIFYLKIIMMAKRDNLVEYN